VTVQERDNISFMWSAVSEDVAVEKKAVKRQNNIKAFGVDGMLHIQNPDKIFLGSVCIYDVTGRKIKESAINRAGDVSLFTGIVDKFTVVVLETESSMYPTTIKVKF
jgi:hypothetical protein